jgi:hypothetical protein
LRGVAIGRKNDLFVGSDGGDRRAAALYSLIETAKLNDLNPPALTGRLLRCRTRAPSRVARLWAGNADGSRRAGSRISASMSAASISFAPGFPLAREYAPPARIPL